MVIVNDWTIVHAIIMLIEIIGIRFALRRTKTTEEDPNYAETDFAQGFTL
jgi:septal ring-binding cell division protein DamX